MGDMAIREPTLTSNLRRMLYREIKSSSQRSREGVNGRSRLTSNEPRTTTTSTNADSKKAKFGFSAKYGRDAASIMSAESQEALKDVEVGSTSTEQHQNSSGGIMKTEEFSVRQEQMVGSGDDDDSMEMVSLGHGKAEAYDRNRI